MAAYGNRTSNTISEILRNSNIFAEEMHQGSNLGGQNSIDLSASGINSDKIAQIIKMIVLATKKPYQILDSTGAEIFSILPSGNIKIGTVEITASVAEINHLIGASSGIQDQINAIDQDHATPIATHKALASDHHAKYTTAEAEAVITAELVNGQLIDNAIDVLLQAQRVLPLSVNPGGGAIHSDVGSLPHIAGLYMPASDINCFVNYIFRLPDGFSSSVTVHFIVMWSTSSTVAYYMNSGYENWDYGEVMSQATPPNSATQNFIKPPATVDYKVMELTRAITSITKEFLTVSLRANSSNTSYIHILGAYLTET